MKRQSLKQQLEMADGCLAMIRDDLVMLGMRMEGCPPMFYNDAMRAAISILARKVGLLTWQQVIDVITAHEAARIKGEA